MSHSFYPSYSGMYWEPTILLAVLNILQKQQKKGKFVPNFLRKKKNAILLARKRECITEKKTARIRFELRL